MEHFLLYPCFFPTQFFRAEAFEPVRRPPALLRQAMAAPRENSQNIDRRQAFFAALGLFQKIALVDVNALIGFWIQKPFFHST